MSIPKTEQVKYNNLSEFLAKHSVKNVTNAGKNVSYTHTRLPNKELNIYPGSYIISKEELTDFYNLIYEHIFEKKNKEYLTEKQLENGGPIVVDFDFKYNYDVQIRQHSEEMIVDIIELYLDELKEFYEFQNDKPFSVYIFEKPNVNRLNDNSLTKDGIHMMFAIQSNHVIQTLLREKMITILSECIDLPLINTWENVLDEGISKGHIGWQLFGCRKPNNEAYEFTYHYLIQYNSSSDSFTINEQDVKNFNLKKNYEKLSARYENNPKFELNKKFQEEYNKICEKKSTLKKKSKNKVNLIVEEEYENNENEHISINNIKNQDDLDKAINIMLNNFKVVNRHGNEYELKEIHEYTQILPEKYYKPGSHFENRLVAFALKHTDDRLFLSWVKLRSKACDFDYNSIPELYIEWKNMKKSNAEGKCVTKQSIIYWAKRYNIEEYEKIKKNTVDFYVERAIENPAEYEFAVVLKHLYKDEYVCVSYDKRGIWYSYNNHRWILDKGLSLRGKISTEMFDLFGKKSEQVELEANEFTDNDTNTNERREFLKKKIITIQAIKTNLKRTTFKDHIMREAAEIFYNADFTKLVDSNIYLLGFNNGVIDFKNKIFRPGYPEDYISKSTKIDYIEYDTNDNHFIECSNEIDKFMNSLFPINDLKQYMWDHLASCLIGTNKNQTFHVYHGSGSNGKSILVEFMSLVLGDYKGTVPVNLVTDSRVKVGGTCDELLKLKGVRYAVMQELTKGAKLNEGIMKELSGSDPMQVRGIYAESEVFIPQFKLAIGTNNLFDIESNDDGTWRRIRKVPFLAKFIDECEYYEDDTQYVFKKDKSFNEKLPSLVEVFAYLLVKRAFLTEGNVTDCTTVMEASKKYRHCQDFISSFITEKIKRTNNTTQSIKKKSLTEEFKLWFQQEQGNRKLPKSEELYEAITKKFKITPHSTKGWIGLEFIRDEEEEEEDIINNL